MKNFIKLQMALLSSLVYEATTFRGLSLEQIVVLCIDGDSEYAGLIPYLADEPATPGKIVCCVVDASALEVVIEALPELGLSLARELPENNTRLLAFGKEGVYSCHLEVLPSRQLLN